MASSKSDNGETVEDNHDSAAEDEFEIDPGLAASMGFSSFGNSSKKRKYNDEAVTDITPAHGKVKQPQGASSGRGANITPLGNRKGPAAPGQEQEPNEKLEFKARSAPIVSHGETKLGDAATSSHDRELPTQGTPEFGAYRNGVRQPNGDIAYFLPSFIEDPWAHFKKKK